MSRRKFLQWFFILFSLIIASMSVLLVLLKKVYALYYRQDVFVNPTLEGRVYSGKKGKKIVSFFVLSDLHISRYDSKRAEHFRWALRDMLEIDPQAKAIFITGDITDFGLEEEYQQFHSILQEFPSPPVYALMGNHDYYHIWLNDRGMFRMDTMPNGRTDEQSRQRFLRAFGLDKVYHDVKLNGIHFLLLSQEAYRQERPEVKEGAWHSHAQFQWLKEKLSGHALKDPLFIFIHQPLPPPGTDGGDHEMIRGELFRRIVSPFQNLFVFSGHTHLDFKYAREHYSQEETFHWFQNSSVGQVLEPDGKQGPFAADLAQGFYVELFENAVVVRGREFSTGEWYERVHWEIPLVK